MATTYMNLTLPTVSSTIGPDWASQLNTALTSIDSHDHSSGKGNRITPAGLHINAELAVGNNAITGIGKTTYQNLPTVDTDNVTSYFKDGDFYVNDNSGNQIRMTAGGALNVGSVGGIGGDYGSTAATCFYTDASVTYFFQDSASSPAKIDVGAIACASVTATGNIAGVAGTFSGAVSGTTGTFSGAVAGTTATFSDDLSAVDGAFSGVITGYGSLPLGAVIAIAADLTGAMSIPASGTIDSNGFQVCDGAAISGSATVSGTIYDLSDERFLIGSTAGGSTGGSVTVTPAGTLSGSQSLSHTHNIAHVHKVLYMGTYGAIHGRTSSSASSTSVSAGDTTLALVNHYFVNGSDTLALEAQSGTSGSTVYTTGVTDGPSGTGASALSGSSSPSVDFSNGAFTGSSLNITPKYMSVVYVMRVK